MRTHPAGGSLRESAGAAYGRSMLWGFPILRSLIRSTRPPHFRRVYIVMDSHSESELIRADCPSLR